MDWEATWDESRRIERTEDRGGRRGGERTEVRARGMEVDGRGSGKRAEARRGKGAGSVGKAERMRCTQRVGEGKVREATRRGDPSS